MGFVGMWMIPLAALGAAADKIAGLFGIELAEVTGSISGKIVEILEQWFAKPDNIEFFLSFTTKASELLKNFADIVEPILGM